MAQDPAIVDEATLEADMMDTAMDANEEAPEERAMHTDTETAHDADEQVLVTDEEAALEEEAAELDAELEEDETAPQKHKNRESTSEKAKRSTRESTSDKAKRAEEEKARVLDPLRLRGKKYRAVITEVDKTHTYPLAEAVALAKKVSTASFGSLELHVKVVGDAIRGTVTLPHGNGKVRNVVVASDEVLDQLAAGKMDFDVLIATPAFMPKLAKFAKILGPKGLMPSPKAGTVTDNPEATIQEINSGRVEYRTDKSGVLHMGVGKLSFTDEQLAENIRVVLTALTGTKIKSISVAPTMGPGVRVAQ